MKIKKESIFLPFGVIAGISLAVFVFYLFYINFSIDAVILFLSSKIFFGKWLMRGVIPLFNPHIYLGIPYLFDVGMGHLHPFNILFLLPYPYSFALWMGAVSFLFLSGFYLLFRKHTKTSDFALLLTVVLFFSGSGIFRSSNPTIFAVIAHYGFFTLSLYKLKGHSARNFLLPLMVGVLMTLSGHVQFVVYGYLLGFIYASIFRIVSLKKLIWFYILLGISVSWYFLLSLPLVFDSTRLTGDKVYISTGNNTIMQYLGLLLPYLFGYVHNGSKWGPGTQYTLLIPLFFTFMFIGSFFRQTLSSKLLLFGLFLASLGAINLPFFRGAGQISVLIHIFGLCFIAGEEEFLMKELIRNKRVKAILLSLLGICTAIVFFASSPFFTDLFMFGYRMIKHGKESLFFDRPTVTAIANLTVRSFMHLGCGILCMLYLRKIKKINILICLFVILEGLILMHHHCYYIPVSVVTEKHPVPVPSKTASHYRIQTASDVVPYFGFATYMGDLIFRPPFSKEKPLFDEKEANDLKYLRMIFSYIPTSWIMTTDFSSVQGYNTFMLADLSRFFSAPSPDFKSEYQYIIARNPLFGENKQDASINSISSGHLTLNDPRWEQLGVKYFISDRPLKKYKLLEMKNGRYIYENPNTKPIYRIVSDNSITAKTTSYNDPNTWKFNISKNDLRKEFQMEMNPEGLVVKLNGKEINPIKEQFLLRIKLTEAGELEIRYSPLFHLWETIRKHRYKQEAL